MPAICKKCNMDPDTPLWCIECKEICCKQCQNEHAAHHQKVIFLCQQCEECPENFNTSFCENCEQHLCSQCSERIHNKGKRAKHIRHKTSASTLKVKRVHIIWDDVLQYYGFINYQAMLMEITDFISPQDPEIIIIEKNKEISQLKNKIDLQIQQFSSQNQFDEDYWTNLKAHYPNLLAITLIDSHKSQKSYQIAKKKCKQCKIQLKQLGQPVKKQLIKLSQISASSLSIPNSSFNNNKSNISAKYPYQQSRNQFGINISTSTQNSLRKRKHKSPIIYFHPYIIPKQDIRSEIEDYYRKLAYNGVLMIKKKNCQNFDKNVLRCFLRNIGQKQIEYVSLIIDTISIQCLYWVIRSIEEDLMAPTEKLILSRLKESFDIKVHSKLWSYVLRYLSSGQYDRDRFQIDRISEIPKLIVKPFNNEDNYILYCRPDDRTPVQWVYEDLGKLDENALQWKQFLSLINEYFLKNTQIGGGRYGCVQYIKFNGESPLKDCSLGKLSMFVQEAINKGFIRYHKTLLVSNIDKSQSQNSQIKMKSHQKMVDLQKKIKINTLQLLLFDIFEQCGPGISLSLAQIPQNLKKSVHFQISYAELGFPKLKNFLATLDEFLDIDLSKSLIVYQLRADSYKLVAQKKSELCADTDELLKLIMQELLQIINKSNVKGMVIQELFNQFLSRTGFTLDYRLFNAPDFINFLSYYGQNYFDLQNNMGYLIVCKKINITEKEPPKTSTPTFKETYDISALKNLNSLNWEQNFLVESNAKEEEQEENQSQSFSDFKSIYNILDDDNSQSKSYPNTVIVKDGSGNNELNLAKYGPIQENSDCSGGFDEGVWAQYDSSKNKNKLQHNRMYSNTVQQKPQHYRVYSNMSPN